MALMCRSVVDFFSLSTAELPAVRLTKEGKDMSIHSLSGAITADNVQQLVRDFLDGKLTVCASLWSICC